MAGLTHIGENLIINEIFRKEGKNYYLGLLKADLLTMLPIFRR